MRIKRREFVEILGGSIAGFPALAANSAARPLAHHEQTARPSIIPEKAFTVSGGGMAVEPSWPARPFTCPCREKQLWRNAS